MHRAYIISLLVLVMLVGFLADRMPDTAAELFPLASALGWIEGDGRALQPELTGSGIRPAHVVRIGANYVPRTSPAMMMYYGAVCKVYKDVVGRSLDGADIPRLIWWINFLGVLPWAILLFMGLHRLAGFWGEKSGSEPIWAAWVGIAGSLAFGWLGVVSAYLPIAALAVWVVALVLGKNSGLSIRAMILAGLLAGFSGAAHPTGWIWVVWGILVIFISPPTGATHVKGTALTMAFGLSAVVGVIISLIGNFLFFGTPLPVQWIDLQPIKMNTPGLIGLLWHDLLGWNGIIWLCPLILIGILMLFQQIREKSQRMVVPFIFGLVVVTLFLWGIADDARLVGEIDNIRPEFSVLPVELSDGEFQLVQLDAPATAEEQQAYFERLIDRTDIFLWMGGRSPGLPVFLPIAVLMTLSGWCRLGASRFLNAWAWVGVRIGGILGLIMSQAAYGNISILFPYIGHLPGCGKIPMLEAIMAVGIKLAELWPDAHITF